MNYPRMKYASEQRDWVRTADKQLPEMIRQAVKAQDDAKVAYEYLEWCLNRGSTLTNIAFKARQEASENAIMLLNRVLYYQGMRNANLPRKS